MGKGLGRITKPKRRSGTVEVMGNSLRELAVRLAPRLGDSEPKRAEGRNRVNCAASLDSLKESGDLEYMADVALFLTQDDKRAITPPARAVTLTVAKNRHGDLGAVPLIFRPDKSNFGEEEWR